MFNIILFGAPGVGKGVQSQLLMRQYDLVHIAPGVLFRQEIKKATPLGETLRPYLDKGILAPEGLVIDTIAARLQACFKQQQGFLFDGYPRSLEQAKALDEQLALFQRKVDLVILLTASDEEIKRRLERRRVVEGRSDDAAAKVTRRLMLYETYAPPIIDYYQKRNLLFSVDGARDTKEVTAHIIHCIQKMCKL